MRKLTVKALTDVGLKRAHNEDYYGFVEALGIYVVCDGMGGHASGEVASRMTVEHIVAFVSDNLKSSPQSMPYGHYPGATPAETLLSNAIQYANDRVYVEGMKDPNLEGMGTTVVAVLASKDTFVVGHVGDSRVYCFNGKDRLSQVSRDHSLLNYKIDRGDLKTAEDIANFAQGNIIVRAIGLKDYVSPEVQTIVRRPGDLLLLCSDGLTDLVDDWLIENVMEANNETLDEGNEALVRMANDRGGKDNITVMMIRVDDALQDGASDYEEVTDPGGIESMEELTDPGLGGMDLEATVKGIPALDLDDESAEPESFGMADTMTDMPQAEASASSANVQVQSGAVAMRRSTESKTATSEASPSVIVSFDDEQPELPSFIIDLD